ncbi:MULTISPECIES: hypothetical protein [Streptomyces]|uniref:Uncharacterized protein n=3 Tax=Streptomyces rimosus TaxID=1927 RepID=L8EQK2_STRR1|nr:MULTISPECIES: hypothetical protein [Streptomyces]MYT41175.1 hypothetical protein [Streptomyces sp. SID5471]KUJ43421.1 hypothetical protein ADK46_00615 [Streptomyces rimosus subsp. rimosus]QDA07181.1 hypothetical protein CTZ40_28975 [Streptomyces rimosus]QEV78459.1 hypothetical protein CP984_28935 [Streptomyces rimosus]QGY69155.1 hypothetical protein V519_027635 [Streptomyces rimosus R6-500]
MPFDPLDINTLTYDEGELRRAALLGVMSNGLAFGGRSGVRPGDPGLTTTLSGTTINVSPGVAWVWYTGQGTYRAALPTAWSGTLQAAHATLSRIDLVYLRVWDTTVDGSGLRQADIVYLPGTPSSTPVMPTPTGTVIGVTLATITVPPVGGGAPSVSLAIRPYTVAPGGILPDATAAGLYTGMYRDNGTDLQRWNGTGWDTYQKVQTVGWTTPTLGTGYTQGNTTDSGNLNGPIRYRKYNDRGTDYMEWDGGANRANGAQVANILSAALPPLLRPTGRASFTIARNATSASGELMAINNCKIDFHQDGTVALVSATAGPTEVNWFSLRGIRYPLA